MPCWEGLGSSELLSGRGSGTIWSSEAQRGEQSCQGHTASVGWTLGRSISGTPQARLLSLPQTNLPGRVGIRCSVCGVPGPLQSSILREQVPGGLQFPSRQVAELARVGMIKVAVVWCTLLSPLAWPGTPNLTLPLTVLALLWPHCVLSTFQLTAPEPSFLSQPFAFPSGRLSARGHGGWAGGRTYC